MEEVRATKWQEAVQHLLAVRRPEQAEQLVRRRLSITPHDAAAHELLGLVLLNLPGREAEAQAAIREAIGLDPQQPDAHYFQSVALLRSSQPFAALQAIDEALRLNPLNATYFGYKAVILNARRQPELALRVADAGLAYNPGHLECLYQRVRALKALHRPEAATQTIGQLARWHPTSFLAHYLLGEEAERQGRTAAAASHLQEALRLHPHSTRAQQKLLPLLAELGRAARQRGEAEAARAYFWQAWHLQPGNPDTQREIEQLAQHSYWLKRQLLRLDAWSEAVQQNLKKGQPRAFLQLYLVMVPLIAVFCLPLLLAMLYATVQWRLHPDVRLLRQHSRRATVGRVALEVGAGLLVLGLIVALRLWLDTVSEEVILLLLGVLALVVGVCLRRQRGHTPSSVPK